MNWLRDFLNKNRKYVPMTYEENKPSNSCEQCNDGVFIASPAVKKKEEYQTNTHCNHCTQNETKPKNEAKIQDYQQILESLYYNKTKESKIPIGSLLFQNSYDSDYSQDFHDSDITYFESRSMTTHYSKPKKFINFMNPVCFSKA